MLPPQRRHRQPEHEHLAPSQRRVGRGRPGDFEVSLRQLPNIVTQDCVNCGICEEVCQVASEEAGGKAIFTEFYDGRVQRTVDLEACTFCGACAEACPIDAIDFSQSPELTTVHAGAILTAVGCEPAPAHLVEHLGYGHENVVTQTELAELMDEWEEASWLGRGAVSARLRRTLCRPGPCAASRCASASSARRAAAAGRSAVRRRP